MSPRPVLTTILSGLLCSLTAAFAIDWPAQYSVAENSTSPDGHFAILVPARLNDTVDIDNAPNYFVTPDSHHVVSLIRDANYTEGQNHASLEVFWSTSSTFCVAIYEGRFAFDSIYLLQPTGKGVTQTSLGGEIEKAIEKAIARQNKGDGASEIWAYCRIGSDSKIRLRALATTNPKQLEEESNHCALFQGTYDPAARRWTVTDARSIPVQQYDNLSTAYSLTDDNGMTFASEKDRSESYDTTLNELYSALRFLLPESQFAKVKASQVEWLKQRNALTDLKAQNDFVLARLKELENYLW